MSAASSVEAARHLRGSQSILLRDLFSQDRWFTNVELARLVGQRFGARILELRRGEDGGEPLDIEKRRLNEAGSCWAYRCVGTIRPEAVTRLVPLRARMAELQELLEAAEDALESANEELRSLGRPPKRPSRVASSRNS